MFSCNACNFKTSTKYNLSRHNQTKKHAENCRVKRMEAKPTCPYCQKKFQSTGGSYYRHIRKCPDNPEVTSELKIKELEHKLELERIKSSYKLKQALASKNLEKQEMILEHLAQKHELELELMSKKNKSEKIPTPAPPQPEPPRQFNQQINISGNPQFINKKEVLNMHFGQVIDIDTFTHNYKNGYGLTYDESKMLLENCKLSGIKACAPNLSCFLKRSYTRQYRDIYGRDPEPNEIILPFILNDSGLRRHYEKTIEGWMATTSMDNIQKFIVISNDQVFNAHQQFIPISAYEKITISNAILRMNSYEAILNNKLALMGDSDPSEKQFKIDFPITLEKNIE